MTKPPPTPKKPVRTPAPIPTAPTRPSDELPPCARGSSRRSSMATAAATSSSAKASRSAGPLISRFSAVPPTAPIAPAAPNASAVLICTRPIRAWSTAPTRAALPTTSSDSVVASLTGWSSTYTSTGTARTEPPPTKPSSSPIPRPKGRASSAMLTRPARFLAVSEADVGEDAVEPARKRPSAVAEDAEQGRHQHQPDQHRVEQDGDAEDDAHLFRG
jgi:hypothetical protein